MLSTTTRLVAAAAVALALVLVACTPASPGTVVAVTIDHGDQSIEVGGTLELTVTIDTTGDAGSAVTWTSSNPQVATIDADGTITTHATGTTDITATSTTDPNKSDTITLTVTAPSGVIAVTIDHGDQSIGVGATLTLTATVETTGDVNDTVIWTSSNQRVATVDSNGSITTYDTGTTEITATSKGDTSKSDTIVLTINPPPGTVAWTRQFGTPSRDSAHGVATDASGNVYVVGGTRGDLEGSSVGKYDAFIRSYDRHGNQRWTRQFGTSGNDEAYAVATDAHDNVYIAGTTRGALEGSSAGNEDAFIRSYDGHGNHRWTRQFGTTSRDAASGVATDPSGNVYVVGRTDGALEATKAGDSDAFIRSYDNDGTYRWTRQFGASNYEVVAAGVSTDASGNVYLTGHTLPVIDGGVDGDSDAFLRAYDGDGTLRWAREFGTSEHDQGHGVATDASGNVYVAGSTRGSLEGINAGEDDAYLRSYDAAGAHRWTRQFGTTARDTAFGVATATNGSVYVVGSTSGDLDGIHFGNHDAFIRLYDTSGAHQRTRQFGTSGYDLARAVATSDDGSVYPAGQVHVALEGTGTGGSDAFVRKYLP